MDAPKLSVIITTYKRSSSLKRAIESVMIVDDRIELIVVDDNDPNSPERSEAERIIEKYHSSHSLMYIKHTKNSKGAAARNTGLAAAKGEYITFLDNDDEFCNRRTEKVIEVLEEELPDFLYTGYEIRSNSKTTNMIKEQPVYSPRAFIMEMLKLRSPIGTGSNMICRKTLAEKIGGFDTDFVRHQDFEFLIRYMEECQSISYIPEVLVVKNDDDAMNFPDFDNYLDVKRLYIKKFSYIIDSLSYAEKREIYKANYYPLLDIACFNNDLTQIEQSVEMIRKYDIYNATTVRYYKIRNFFKRQPAIRSAVVRAKDMLEMLFYIK